MITAWRAQHQAGSCIIATSSKHRTHGRLQPTGYVSPVPTCVCGSRYFDSLWVMSGVGFSVTPTDRVSDACRG